jgi:hypothetical protein
MAFGKKAGHGQALQSRSINLGGDGDGGAAPPSGELPIPTQTLYANPTGSGSQNGSTPGNALELGNAITAINNGTLGTGPGTQITYAAGTYPNGGYNITRDGTAAHPIVFNLQSGVANFTKANNGNIPIIALSGDWLIWRGGRYTGDTRKFDITGKNVRLCRATFDGIHYDGMVYLPGANWAFARIEYNEFLDIYGAAIRGDGLPIGAAASCYGVLVRRNQTVVHHCQSLPDGNESVFLFLTSALNNVGLRYEYNLFDRVLLDRHLLTDGQGEIITIKTGWTTLLGNEVRNSNNSYFSLRETINNTIQANYMDSTAFIKAHGDGHLFKGNKFPSGGRGIEISSGNAFSTDASPAGCSSNPKWNKTVLIPPVPACPTAHCACRNSIAEDNIGVIFLGKDNDSNKCDNITLRRNDRLATRSAAGYNAGTCTSVAAESATVGNQINTAVPLTADDVGPNGVYVDP